MSSAAAKLQDLTAELQAVQNEYMGMIQTSIMKGDTQEVLRLQAEFTKKVQEISSQIFNQQTQQLQVVQNPHHSYESRFSNLDLNSFVFHGERAHFEEILADKELWDALQSVKAQAPSLTTLQTELNKTALRLNLHFTPRLRGIVERCEAILGLKAKLNLYVCDSPQANAWCYPTEGESITIMITSRLLESFSDSEIAFVMGHELGHALFDHASVPGPRLLQSGHPALTPIRAMRLFAWKRAAEVTADRVGLLCGESFEKSARALFKVSYGFNIEEDSSLRSYVEGFYNFENEIGEHVDPNDFFTTHPFGPTRLVALDLFAKSEAFAQLVKKSSFELNREDMENKIMEIVAHFESSYLNDPNSINTEMKHWMLLAGVGVALADGNVTAEELTTLSSLLAYPVAKEEFESRISMGIDALRAEMKELSRELTSVLSFQQKCLALRDVCFIALADGRVDEREVALLKDFCREIDIADFFIDDVLSGAFKGFD